MLSTEAARATVGGVTTHKSACITDDARVRDHYQFNNVMQYCSQYDCTVTVEVSADRRNALYSPHYLIGDGYEMMMILSIMIYSFKSNSNSLHLMYIVVWRLIKGEMCE